jgi:hypothetical protein
MEVMVAAKSTLIVKRLVERSKFSMGASKKYQESDLIDLKYLN